MEDLNSLQARYNNGQSLEFIFFSAHQKTANGVITKACLSPWYNVIFEMNNVKYNCVEQYIMSEKAKIFEDYEAMERIFEAYHPNQMKLIGKKIKNYNEDIWNENKIKLVKIANLAKFSQNTKLKKYLRSTKDKVLVKAISSDNVWGIGMSENNPSKINPNYWMGLNLYGFILMDVRNILL